MIVAYVIFFKMLYSDEKQGEKIQFSNIFSSKSNDQIFGFCWKIPQKMFSKFFLSIFWRETYKEDNIFFI